MTSSPRRLSLPRSLVTFVLLSAAVVGFAMAMLILIDPRTQEFWAARLGELGAWLREILPG